MCGGIWSGLEIEPEVSRRRKTVNPSVGSDSSDEGDDPGNDGVSDLGNTSGGIRTRVWLDGGDLQPSSPSRATKELLTLLPRLKPNISGVGLVAALFKEEENDEFFQ
ncbi:hypothetical protein L484_022054 [Morus notabilis]|uniref:Uncharacterized protein n=1 Tax=Morus notabilis TaxID=981085 RepID=W9RXF2_9ROSA|nr:hypothetical protein L484_022054 [Morus notabilis]